MIVLLSRRRLAPIFSPRCDTAPRRYNHFPDSASAIQRIGALLNFIHENFLLYSKSAERLYHGYAAAEPILDYHSHLPATDIADDRQFADLFEIWLEGDHYKWRAMRANGVPERQIT